MQRFVVELLASGDDEQELIEISEDLAWEAVMAASRQEGLEVGGEVFVEAFQSLKLRYAECARHFGHLTHIAATTLKVLMDSGLAIAYPAGMPTDEDSIRKFINNLVGVVLSTSTSIYAVGPSGWIPNEQWDDLPEDQRTITFNLIKPDFYQESDENND